MAQSPDDARVPISLAYHLSDIYLEELEKAFASPPVSSPPPAPLATLLEPFLTLAARTPTNTTYQRVQSTLFEPLFSALRPLHCNNPPNSKRPRLSTPTYPSVISNSCVSATHKEGPMAPPELMAALLQRIFEVASDEGTRDPNRRKIYAFWKDFEGDEEENEGAR
jgi:ribosomal RNA-processing protein 1